MTSPLASSPSRMLPMETRHKRSVRNPTALSIRRTCQRCVGAAESREQWHQSFSGLVSDTHVNENQDQIAFGARAQATHLSLPTLTHFQLHEQ